MNHKHTPQLSYSLHTRQRSGSIVWPDLNVFVLLLAGSADARERRAAVPVLPALLPRRAEQAQVQPALHGEAGSSVEGSYWSVSPPLAATKTVLSLRDSLVPPPTVHRLLH